MHGHPGCRIERDSALSSAKAPVGDVNELASALTGWSQRYEQLACGRFSGFFDELWVAEIQLVRERANLDMLQSGAAWPGARVFGVPLTLRGQAIFAGQSLTTGNIAAHGPHADFDLRVPGGLDLVSVAIPASAFCDLVAAEVQVDPETLLKGRCVWSVPPDVVDRFRSFLRELFRISGSGDLNLRDSRVSRNLQFEVQRQLVALIEHLAPVPSSRLPMSVRRSIVQNAQDYALSMREQPPTIAEVCRALRVSQRHLQDCFQEILGMSPYKYLTTVRLNGMRRDLLAARALQGVRIGDVAARWGFWHLSNCAAAYRRLFGELPSDTVNGPSCPKETTGIQRIEC